MKWLLSIPWKFTEFLFLFWGWERPIKAFSFWKIERNGWKEGGRKTAWTYVAGRGNGCFKEVFVSGLFSYPLGNFEADKAKAAHQTISPLFQQVLLTSKLLIWREEAEKALFI